MSPEAPSPRAGVLPLLPALVVYACLVVTGVAARRDAADPDGVSYIRNAGHLAGGRLALSVSGYWSPLLSWSIAALQPVCDGPLEAAWWALAAWGAVYLAGVSVLADSLVRLTPLGKFLLLLPAAVAAAGWATLLVTPDIILAALVNWYFAASVQADFVTSKRGPLLAGVLGGLAYLAKSYAFPFFLAHHTFNSGLHWAFGRPRVTWRSALAAWILGLVGFAAVAGPWIAVLSGKYGSFTFSKSAALNHYLVGGPLDERNMVFRRAQVPPADRMSVWETPEDLQFEGWSPLAGADRLRHQTRHAGRILGDALRLVTAFDLLSLTPGLVGAAVVVALARGNRDEGRRAIAAVAAVTLYVAGLSPVLVSAGPRHIAPIVWPTCAILAFGFLDGARRGVGESYPGSFARAASVTMLIGAAAVYTLPAARDFFRENSAQMSAEAAGLRQFGRAVRESGVRGPVAVSPRGWLFGTSVCYHAAVPYRGEVTGKSVPDVVAELNSVGAHALVARSDWKMAAVFGRESGWRPLHAARVGDHYYQLFAAP